MWITHFSRFGVDDLEDGFPSGENNMITCENDYRAGKRTRFPAANNL